MIRAISAVATKMLALFCGILAGSILTVVIVNRNIGVLIDSLVLLKSGWTNPVEQKQYWLLELEWNIVIVYAVLIAVAASTIWGAAALWWRTNYAIAISLGFLLSALAMGIAESHRENPLAALLNCFLIGCAGAIAGAITLRVDRSLQRPHPNISAPDQPGGLR
jgi:hypothetical protein